MAVPWITRVPRAWTKWEVTLWSEVLSMRRDDEVGRNPWESDRTGDFYVTSEARAGCELAY